MNQPRLPSDVQNWEPLDIYLFSNGQEYSPPRKYHLRPEDLNWWDSTLGYLARSQYGSLHFVIDLYTLQGEKIYSPRELNYGMAYVAVVPPDPFIDTGYSQYIMKASKSWEKRQSRKSSSNEKLTKPDEITIKTGLSKSDTKKDIINIKTPKQNIVIETRESIKTEDPTTEAQKPQITITTSPQTIRKRKPLVSHSTRASILRKLTNTVQSQQDKRKTPLKRKEESLKGNIKIISTKPNETNVIVTDKIGTIVKSGVIPTRGEQRRDNLSKVGVTSITENSIPRQMVKTGISPIVDGPQAYNKFKITDILPNIEVCSITEPTNPNLPEFEEFEPKNDVSTVTKTTNASQKTQRTDSTQADFVLEDKDIIIVSDYINRSKDSELMSMFMDADSVPFMQDYNQPSAFSSTTDHNKQLSATTNSTPALKNGIILSITEAAQSTPVSNVMHPSQPRKQNNTQRKQNGTTPPLSPPLSQHSLGKDVILHLNIEVSDGAGVTRTFHTDIIHKSRSLTDVNDANNNGELLRGSKSLNSVANKCCFCRNDSNTVTVRCACDQNNAYNAGKSKDKENKTYFIVVPIINHFTNDRFKRDQEVQQNPSEKVVEPQILETQNSEQKIIVNFMENVITYPLSIEYKEKPKCKPTCGIFNSEHKLNYTKSIMEINTLTVLRDASTQTDWCNVLLEVRRHGSCHYTFHLPPLQRLKNYEI